MFVTYAQNFEDLMLMRALKDVKGGFYIDVGANHPVDESVTKAFYDRGWSGINIEPDPEPFALLEAARPRDINLNVGVWSEPGEKTFHIIEGCSALSTTNDFLLNAHKEAGRPVKSVTLQLTDLRTVCEQHVGDRTIHFLKVDVEGAEREVLEGFDFDRWRPWVIVLETNGPDPKSKHHLPAQSILLHNQYITAYFDGLNRFYIPHERWNQLGNAFMRPPNCFDDWIRYRDIRFAPSEILPADIRAEIGRTA